MEKRAYFAWFKRLDFYGHSVAVNYRGQSKFSTNFGALVSLLVFGLIFSYTSLRFKKMVLFENPNISKNTVFEDISQYGNLTASENRFDFGFTFINLKNWSYDSPDPSIATVSVRRVEMTTSPQISFARFPLPINNC